ncbi:MAG: succinyl-diaminopimelate desuccinylase [Rhodospirillales bacterium]|nr:succinyl-diaminopimelate desuccinylase [Rhodospirillales bacterium]
MSAALDPLALAQALIRCPSVTPEDAGALDVLEHALKPLGFVCHRLRFESPGTPPVSNLYARLGAGGANFCFAGHTDVVPVGDAASWTCDPFGGEVHNGKLWGRGASDMKAAIACFVAAVARRIAAGGITPGSVSLLITGDEEGPAINGTAKMLQWLSGNGERLSACLVGEPTNPTRIGEMIKIGRRGSLNAKITAFGVQGHAAYPEVTDNPVPRLVRLLAAIDAEALDTGSAHFQPSAVAITSIDVGNPATNVIPARAEARLNIRFNDHHSGTSLSRWLERHIAAVGGRFALDVEVSGEAFVTPPGALSTIVADAVTAITGRTPQLTTGGGTSDARFIKDFCPVVEFGMAGDTAHKVDESIDVADVETLTAIYGAILDRIAAGD